MRRKDREVTCPERIEEIIKSSSCCRVGFSDNGEIYIVPLSFGYERANDRYTLYFHGATEGRKMELAKKSPRVGFEMDCGGTIAPASQACKFSASFQSVIGNGIICSVTSLSEKTHGLSLIMEHYTGATEWDFPEKMLDAMAVLKLEVESLSCKENRM